MASSPKKKGILRLAVPDLDVMFELYIDSGRDINQIQGYLMGGQDHRFNFHMAIFNRKRLKPLLEETGFMNVKDWHPGSSHMTTMNDSSSITITYNGRMYPISLNLEATKI
jgi:predicted SAM-dependent methyltransferase